MNDRSVDDVLDYQSHLRHYRSLFAITTDSRRDQALAAEREAQYDHALYVFDALRDWSTKAVLISRQLTNENAAYYMKYGAGRRLSMMFYAYQEITQTADAKRTQPLSHEEQQTLSRDINVLYMHARGVLDNFAWCLLFEKHPDRAKNVNRLHVGLFDSRFKEACPSFAQITQPIGAHAAWNKDMTTRRDPVAHRIPLYIPPTSLTPEEQARYERLGQQHIDQAAQDESTAADNTLAELERIGTFLPYFLHHPDEGVIPIYPTVPTDMAHVIQIGEVIEHALTKT